MANRIGPSRSVSSLLGYVDSERIGEVLAAEGKPDAALLESLAAEAKRHGRLFGDQLVADGLLAPTEVAAALERQAVVRFERALMMGGAVSVDSAGKANPVMRRSLGAAVLAAFRAAASLDAITELFIDLPNQFTQIPADDDLAALGLLPAEHRVCRRLAAGENIAQLLADAPNEVAPRLVGALLALRLVS